jgi:hypothetical protein
MDKIAAFASNFMPYRFAVSHQAGQSKGRRRRLSKHAFVLYRLGS